MQELCFSWDRRKATQNERKHGVTFEEAKSAFLDEYALLIDDPDHSDQEERFVLLGVSSQLRVLVVCHCYRKSETEIRIISARKANRQERADYSRRVPR